MWARRRHDQTASFADILVANCTNNGIVAIAVDVDEIAHHPRLTIDHEKCEIRDERHRDGGEVE